MRRWATRKLRSGDLTALAAIANGAARPEPERVGRLTERGFVVAKPNGNVSATLAGRIALLIKRVLPI